MSKFQAIMDAKRGETSGEAPNGATTTAKPRAAKDTAIARDFSPSQRKRGRPPGKRSDPDFEAITAYIRKDTHRDVKIALLRKGNRREFSELVEDLLVAWLKGK